MSWSTDINLPKPPKILPSSGLLDKGLVDACTGYIDDVIEATKDEDDWVSADDHKEYIYQAALEAVYGKEVWEYLNHIDVCSGD